jgi:hypothetical protein
MHQYEYNQLYILSKLANNPRRDHLQRSTLPRWRSTGGDDLMLELNIHPFSFNSARSR